MTDQTETKKTRTRITYPEINSVPAKTWRDHPRVRAEGYYKDRLDGAAGDEDKLDRNTTPATVRLVAYNLLELRPTWTAKCINGSSVELFAEGKPLGEISHWYSRRSSEYGVEIDCDRIRAKSGANRAKRTADVKAAIRLALDNFFPKTDTEVWDETSHNAKRMINSLVYGYDRKRASAESNLREHAFQFAMTIAKGEFLASLDEDGRKHYENLESFSAQHAIASAMQSSNGDYTPLKVLEDGGFLGKLDGQVIQFTADTLPTEAHNAFVLKMAPEDEVIDGIGVKLAPDTLLVKIEKVEQ